MNRHPIVILGATATGKTSLAVRLAAEFQGEIISADSRQVYRGMDIGTGKDLAEYRIAGQVIACHLIDIAEPGEEFNVYDFKKRFTEVYEHILQKNRLPILVGGTGLYLEAVLMNYVLPQAPIDDELRAECEGKTMDALRETLMTFTPKLHNLTDLQDRDRLIRRIEIERARKSSEANLVANPNMNAMVFGIRWDRATLRKRIAQRLHERLEEGMIEEVTRLHDHGVSWERLDRFGLEYRYVSWYLQNRISREDMVEKLTIAIGQFAKRQETWFRRMEKKGIAIHWIDGDDYKTLRAQVAGALRE